MLLDKQTMFSDAQSLIHAAGAWFSDNVIDLWGSAAMPSGPLGTPVFDVGRGSDVHLLVQIVETFLAAAGAATLQVELVQADDAALTANVEVLVGSQAIAKAALVAGYQFRLHVLPTGITRRYIGLRYTIATNPGTAGKMTAGIVVDCQNSPGSFV